MKYYSVREAQLRYPRILKEAPFVITNRGTDQCLILPIEDKIAQDYVRANSIEPGVTAESLTSDRINGFAVGVTSGTIPELFSESQKAELGYPRTTEGSPLE